MRKHLFRKMSFSKHINVKMKEFMRKKKKYITNLNQYPMTFKEERKWPIFLIHISF